MPVSVITDVVTWIELIAQLGVTGVELGVLSYLVFDNGWLDMIRLISFWLDTILIKFVDKMYSYFDKLLNGTVFAPDVVDRVMDGVYVLVAAFVLFKLMMLLMKYITNPEMVSDEKLGASSLVKRVIIGMCLMLFLPTIFNLGMDLQSAILTDNLFGRILLDKDDLKEYEENKNQMGRVLAFNVYQAFWNLDKNRVTSKKIIRQYENAVSAYDPTLIGGLTAINQTSGGDYAYDYFPFLSSVMIGYVLFLVIKYCIDVVVRMFKLFILQMLGPLAITDYMVNGDSKEMFKSWVKTTLSAYAMLFMRIFSIWFVAFVTQLMDETCTTEGANGVCADSVLYIVGGEPDYLLRGLITLGLLAFLMDLPKLLSSVFGLDLEQDASVKGLMQKVGGAAKMLGVGAMAAGGAALGGAIGGLKNTASQAKGLAQANLQNKGKLDAKIASGNSAQASKMKELLKDPQKNKKDIARLRSNYLKANPKSAEALDYKRSQRNAGMSFAGQVGKNGVAGGLARGAFGGASNSLPGLKEFSGGFGQATNSMERNVANTAKGFNETAAEQGAYRRGAIDAWSEERAEVLTGNSNLSGADKLRNTAADGVQNPQQAGKSTAHADMNGGKKQGTMPKIVQDPVETLSDRINRTANVHDAPTREEHLHNKHDSVFANMTDAEFKDLNAKADAARKENK